MKAQIKSGYALVSKSFKDSLNTAPPQLKRHARRVLVTLLVLLTFITGIKFGMFKIEEMRLAAERTAGPKIRVASITKGVGEHSISVVGETRPFESATLYAKISGYLKSIVVDKGDIVKQGQVLATIESPETDEAYLAAEADGRNKRAIWTRMQSLLSKGLVSQQEADQAKADFEVSNAKLRSQATVKGYETLRAPFDGTITARYADPGALVQNATSSETSSLPVVMISQIKRLRVDVFLDQRDAPYVSKDDHVEITLSERPGFKILGQLARLSGELDPRTKMLLAEIDIPNDDRSLVAGSFVQVSLRIKSPPYLETPVESLVMKDNKPNLTVITPQNTLTFKPVDIASNDGKIIRIISGVEAGDMVALNVGETIPEGGKVRPIVEAPTSPKVTAK